MATLKQLALLRKGIPQWNKWRNQHQQTQLDLTRADLYKADLREANLKGANLRGTDLRGARLDGADLTGANLLGADLSYAALYGANLQATHLKNANLTGARLRSADLRRAVLQGANLSEADLNQANLSGADLSQATLYETTLSGANLSGAIAYSTIFAKLDLCATKGLVEIQHKGPSQVSLNTTQLPQDGSALHFLRGVGIPDEWIDFYRATMMHPVQYHSCFISYSSRDDVLARRLHADLQDQGVRCWFAPEDMKIGDKIRTRIDEAIHLQDKLLLLLSEHAIISTWVEDEVEAGLEKEQRQQREVIFPVRLDESIMHTTRAWAAKLRRTRHIGNFTYWTDPQIYQQAFDRLLRDLKTDSSKPKH